MAIPSDPTQIGVGAVVILLVLREVFKFIIDMKSKSPDKDKNFMTEKEHTTQCELASLRMEKHFKHHFDKLKNDVFKEFRKLEKAIAKRNEDNGSDDG